MYMVFRITYSVCCTFKTEHHTINNRYMLALTFYRCIKSILYLLVICKFSIFKIPLVTPFRQQAHFFWAILSNIGFAILFLENNTNYVLLNLLSPSHQSFPALLGHLTGYNNNTRIAIRLNIYISRSDIR